MNCVRIGPNCFPPIAMPVLLFASLVGGCASIPDVTVTYRPVRWAVLITVAHTITCNRENTLAIVERGAVFLPLYSAAPPDTRFRIRLQDLNRYTADSDIAIAFTDDGRLKSINQSTTGQGEAAVKGVVGLAAAVAAQPPSVPLSAPPSGVSLFSQNVFKGQVEAAKPSTVCAVVQKRSLSAPNQLAQVSLVQTGLVKSNSGSTIAANPSKDQEHLLLELKKAGLDLATEATTKLSSEELQPIAEPVETVASDEVPVVLQRMRELSVEVTDTQGTIGSKSVPVPMTSVLVLPVPKAALIGKQSFSLTVAESGKIVTIGYGRTSGAPGAFGAATAIASAEVTEDTAEAAAMKAASDLIAQQQRYNNCKLKPSDCK